jgi:carbamoyltransferase
MEFGPRSLGGRSIIADPRSPVMQKKLNLKIKFRESFRPFAPSILEEDCDEWFSLKGTSPYMLFVSEILEKHRLVATENLPKEEGLAKQNNRLTTVPAVTHVDYSARVQTVSKETNEDFYNLILKFKELTGCPILVNTSFNVRGEPIVCSPRDAFECFMGTNLDILVVGKCFLRKDSQNTALASKCYFKYWPD